jgi:protein-disulfide isomerase
MAILAVASLGVSLGTFVLTSRQVAQVRADLESLQAAHRELASQVVQGTGRGDSGTLPNGGIIDVAGAPARGPADAVVALVEFSDYECPYCIRHFHQTMPEIEQNYIDTGKIRYVFRDFPIDQNHPQAIRAHEAAHCAIEQGKFWDLHPKLFSAPGTHTPIALDDLAKSAGLDEAQFKACIASGRTTGPIRDTVRLAEQFGATGTPWFFVGIRDPKTEKVRVLRPIGGAQPYEQFAIALDAALKTSTTN